MNHVRPSRFLARIMMGVHFNERCCGDDGPSWDSASQALNRIIEMCTDQEQELYSQYYRMDPSEP